MLQPYKSTKVNNYHTSIQLILAITCFLIALLDQATIRDHLLIRPVVYLIEAISISPILITIFYITYKIGHKIQAVLPKMLGNVQVQTYSENKHYFEYESI